jgi:hypothetical protein
MYKKINSYIFKIDGGKGKNPEIGPYCWPDHISIEIPENKILDIAIQILSSFKHSKEGENIRLAFLGKLDYDVPEDT